MGCGTKRLAWSCAIVCVLVGTPTAQVEYTNNFRFNSGQSVQPIFEGWSRLPDGSINLHFGYLNRNYAERPQVSVGANNRIEPGGPDRGQPTFFNPRTYRNLFTVNVPKGWDPKHEVIWSLTVNGKTERAVGWLQPEWQIDPAGGSSGADTTTRERQENKPPTIAIKAVAPVALPAKASLVATVRDDGLPKPRPVRKPPVGQETPPTLQGGTDGPVNVPAASVALANPPGAGGGARAAAMEGLRVTWIVWRGPASATFEPAVAQPKDGNAVTAATFTKPGAYVLRGTVTDGFESVSRLVDVAVQ